MKINKIILIIIISVILTLFLLGYNDYQKTVVEGKGNKSRDQTR